MRTKRKRRQSAGFMEKSGGAAASDENSSRKNQLAAIAKSISAGRYFIDGRSVAEAIIRRGGFRGNS